MAPKILTCRYLYATAKLARLSCSGQDNKSTDSIVRGAEVWYVPYLKTILCRHMQTYCVLIIAF